MYAGQVIDMQADLLDRLQHSTDFQNTLKYTLTQPGEQAYYKVAHKVPAMPQFGTNMVETITNHVQISEAYHVNGDMVDLLTHAAEVLEDSDLIDLEMAPTGCGLVRFDKPLRILDVRGKVMYAHWLTWGPAREADASGSGTRNGTYVTFWNDLNEPDEIAVKIFADLNEKYGPDVTERQRKVMGRWAITSGCFIPDAVPLMEHLIAPPEDVAEKIRAEGDEPSSWTNTVRYVHALWLLLNQTIVSKYEENLTGGFKRRAEKKNLPSRVTMVRLRRTESKHHEGSGNVEWSHTWLVRGHWRWQPYGPGRSERRRIWINPHVKGPEGAPLKVSTKVYALHR